MLRIEKNGIIALQFSDERFKGFIHGIFTRNGGVSSGQWSSLNQGSTVGDDRRNVIENRRRAFHFFERDVNSIYDVWQVHGNEIVCTQEPKRLNEPHIKADAIFTNNPDLTLFMRFADCVPIMLCDPKRKIAGIVHAGWKGTVNNIIGEAIQRIKTVYDVKAEDIIAGIGPSIGPDHYVVGSEVVQRANKIFGSENDRFFSELNGSIFFDLWRANEFLLRQNGVNSIECAGICTACHLEDWYSHRNENGKTGRFGALIAIKKE